MSATKRMSNEPTTSSPPLSFSAVEVAGNTDLLTEILIRVPIKSLIRFKSVSKLWLSLISDPKFSLLHRRPSHPSAAAGLFLEGSNGEYDFFQINNSKPSRPLKSLDFGTGLSIVQSCNGLLLCWDKSGSFCVFNPTTKRRTTLPPPPAYICFPYSLNLAFDPSKSPHYKAICIRNFPSRKSQDEVEIYSSETGTWRLSSLGFVNSGLRCWFDRGVFWNGSVYWISPPSHFLRFEVDAGQVHEIPMPPVTLNNCYMSSCYPQVSIDHLLNYNAMPPVPECLNCMASCYLQVSRGHLHFIDRHLDPGCRFLVYEMERDGSGWFVKYEVDVSQVFRRFHFDHEVRMRHLYVLCLVRCEVEAESYLWMNIVGKVLRYNFKDGSFCWLTVDKHLNPNRVYPFIESLACV